MQQIVKYSAQEYIHGSILPIRSFNAFSDTETSKFEVTFIYDEVRYRYGFVANKYQIFEEYLIAYTKNAPQKMV